LNKVGAHIDPFNKSLAAAILANVFALPKTSAISNGPIDIFWPQSATRKGHNK
jgi:hypothetical protein